jgi:4-hydroxybenzoate polyprenyltransferase
MFMSGAFDFRVAALVSLAMIATYSSQAVYNCINDVEGDKVNASWQPLASGQMSTGFAWKMMAALAVMGLALFWLAVPQLILLGVAFVLLGVFYSAYAKARHFVSYTTLVTTHMAMPMAAGYLLAGQIDLRLAVAIGFIYMTEVLSMSIKDYKDVPGDRRVGLRTLPIVLGPQKAALVTFAGFCSPFILSWIPWLVLNLNPAFLAASLASGAARIFLGLGFLSRPDSGQGKETLNKFRYVRIAQMLSWCLI